MRSWLLCTIVVCALVTFVRAESPASDSFKVNGVRIHYLLEGTGEPVVLIHGWNSSAQINWNMTGVITALAEDHRVVALDLPGHGQSDKPESEDAYGVQMVEDVVLLMDHLDIKRARIVGYSMGGMVAVKFLVLHPERAISCVLGGMGWLRDGGGLQRIWEQMPVREGSPTPPACVHGFGKLAVTQEQLKAIRTPMMILIGDRDPVRRLYVDPLRQVRPDWKVVEIKEAGHLNCIFKPQFKEAIVNWVQDRKSTR